MRIEASSNLKVHEVAGMPVPELRPATYKAAVSGWYNKDEEDGRRKKLRQAVTLTHMEMMKLLLKVNEPRWTLYHKRLLFTIATLAFWGALRYKIK